MAFLTSCLTFAPGAVFPFPVGVLQGLPVDQQRILWVELMAVPTKLCSLKVRGPLNTPMIGYIAWILGSVPLSLRWAEALVLPDMASRAGDTVQLELWIKVAILCIALSALNC